VFSSGSTAAQMLSPALTQLKRLAVGSREREREQPTRFSPHYLSDSKVCPADNNAPLDVYECDESAFYHSLG
jgi:hypothetical protein